MMKGEAQCDCRLAKNADLGYFMGSACSETVSDYNGTFCFVVASILAELQSGEILNVLGGKVVQSQI